MSNEDKGAEICGAILILAIILYVIYLAILWVIQNWIIVVSAIVILIILYLIISGKFTICIKKYQVYKEEKRKKQIAIQKEKIESQIDSTKRYIQSLQNCPNSAEVTRLISQSYSYLHQGDLEAALDQIKRAEQLANSTIDSTLAEARNIALHAESNYNLGKYSDAIEQWRQSLNIYANAENISQNTNDKELFKRLKEVRGEILENIKKSEIGIDRQHLSEFVKNGNQKIISAKKLFDDKKFDDAKSNYESSKEQFTQAMEIVNKRNFSDKQTEITGAIKRINSSIESVILGKSHALMEEGNASFQNRKFTESENYYSLAIRLLEENTMERDEAEFIRMEARKGQIAAKLEQGKEKMRNADQFYTKGQYYEAKEQYKSAREFIEKISEDSSRYQFFTLHSALSQLSKRCTENMNVATTAMMNVGGVEHAIITVDNIEEAQAEFKLPGKSKQFLEDQAIPGKKTLNNLPSELIDIYPDWKYLDKGGFARVFKCKKKDGAFVAVKIPLSMDVGTGKTFIAEMQNWKKLSHNNIVKLYDFNIMPIPYLEEELCDSALAGLKKPVETDDAAWILFNICEGLKFAHAQKLIHRDLKPQNILLKNGLPKISDWGLSRIITESTTTTSTSFTSYYAAPEQINNGVKDERTDIWQLGVILYELVTGELPFKGDSMIEIWSNIATKDPKLPGELNPDAKVLDTIVMKCLKKDPAKRYQAVIEIQKDLAQFLQITYTESLKMSETAHDYKRSAYYCGKLVMSNMQTGNIIESYKYLQDLAHYAQGDVKIEVQELSGQIEMRMDMGLTEIPDDLIQKSDFIIHKISLGF